MSMAQVEVTQTLPYPGKQHARREAAEADTLALAADVDALRARLAAEVRATYARLYATDQEQASISAAKEFVEVLVATAAARYGAGHGDIEALAKIELERSGLDERDADIGVARASLVATLNRLTGRDEMTVIGSVDTLPDPALPPGTLLDAALTHSPELRVERASIDASSRRLRAAETETTPNFIVGLAAGAGVSGDPIITLRFGAELPVWRGEKQEPMIRAAEHDVQAAREELRDGELRTRAELGRLAAQWKRDRDQIERYRDAIIPQSSVAFDAARSAYATGRGDFTTVADDFRRWLDARLGLSRREADRFTTWAELQSIIAAPPRRRASGDTP
jgi:outer membrane protein TolC